MRGNSSQNRCGFIALRLRVCASWSRVGFACALAMLAAGVACKQSNKQPAKAQIVEQDPNVIQIDDPSRFSIVSASTRSVFDVLHVNGVVAPDVNRTVPVLSLSGGRAVDIRTRLGDDVRKGQVLVRISSPDVSSAFSDFQKFEADELLARKQLQRSQVLYEKGAIAQKDLEVAEDTENKAKVDLATALDHIHILGGNPRHPSPVLNVVAPISGTIVEQNVVSGTGVRSMDNSPNLFTIADLSRVWVLCDAYEDLIAKVHEGDAAEIHADAFPDRVFRGKISNISRVLDPNTRTAKVRIEIDNPGRLLRSGMFVTASFKSAKPETRVVIPASAVVHLHDKDWVFVPIEGNRFHRREVQLGATLSGNQQEVEVIAGLEPDAKVVEKALQFASASESQ